MESKPLTKKVVSALAAGDNWSDGFEIFQSLEEQQLLPEEASSNSVIALLAVHNLEDRYALQMRHNAEYMAPKQGDLPFLRYKNQVIGAEELLTFLKEKEYVLNSEQTADEELLMLGVLSIIKTRLIPLELYCVWMDDRNIEKTCEKYAYDQPKHLGKLLCWQKKQKVKSILQAAGLLDKSYEQILEEAGKIFSFFSQKLEKSKYITGNTLTEADVLVYGHIQAILESNLERNILLESLENFPNLKNFCLRFSQLHLGQKAMLF